MCPINIAGVRAHIVTVGKASLTFPVALLDPSTEFIKAPVTFIEIITTRFRSHCNILNMYGESVPWKARVPYARTLL